MPALPRIDTKDKRYTTEEGKLIDALDKLWDEGKKFRDRWAPSADLERDRKLYRGEVGPKGRDPYFEGNFIQSFIDRMVGQLTDNRPVIRVDPRKMGLGAMARAFTIVARATWQDAQTQRQTFKMCHNAGINRSAGFYTGYDPTTDEIVLETLTLDQVVVDPSIKEAALIGQKAEYIGIERVKPLEELTLRFPGRTAGVKADATISDNPDDAKRRTVLSPIKDLLKGNSTAAADAVGRTKVKEMLVIDRTRYPTGTLLFPAGRMIFYTADRVLFDGPKPYWDAEHQVDWFDWIVDPQHPFGLSQPQQLMRLQLSFNQIMDGLVENQLLSNVMTVLADWDALDETAWKRLQKLSSSLVLRKKNRNASVAVTPPPSFGGDKIQLARFIFTIAQLLTGVTDVTLGETPGSLQSGQAIEGLQEGANLGTRTRASRLEDFFMRVGQKLVARIAQFRTSDQVVSLLGPTGDAIEYAIKRQEFFARDDGSVMTDAERRETFKFLRFIVAPGSSAPGSRERRGERMFKLHVAGLVPGEEVLRAADVPDAESLYKRAQEEMAKRSPDIQQKLQQLLQG